MFSFFREWIFLLIPACIAAALCDLFSSGTTLQKSGIQKTIRLIIGLCISSAVILPVFSAFTKTEYNLPFSNSENILEVSNENMSFLIEDSVFSMTKIKLENELKQKLQEKLGINISELSIELDKKQNGDITEIFVSETLITIAKEEKEKSQDLVKYINELLYCNVVIKIEDE